MGYSKHEYTTINMLYSPKKFVDITPLPPHIGHLSTMATFLCPQGGLYGEVRLYLLLFARSSSTLVLLGYGYLLDMIEKIQKRVRLRMLHHDLSYLGVRAVTFFPVPPNQAK